MKAIEFRRFGSPDVLQSVDVATPSPGRGEALVRVGAVGVNYFEVLMRQDRYAVTPELPMIPGVEVAGVVVAVGEDLSQDIIGSRVAVPMFAHGRVPADMPNMYRSMPRCWYRSRTDCPSKPLLP